MTEQLGKPILRKEDPALLSGRGRFADDLPVPAGTLHAHVIRSPHAHARIMSIEAKEALAQERVRYVGEPVALVVADSRYLAEDAAELVHIEYEAMEAVLEPRAACDP